MLPCQEALDGVIVKRVAAGGMLSAYVEVLTKEEMGMNETLKRNLNM